MSSIELENNLIAIRELEEGSRGVEFLMEIPG